ncbi:phosphatidylserine decarboxylase-domain-containing protein [Daldinia sp. FL1419]|nr:phosphatidylserine decarboxylase-domain-containing protein [Daldinia sp. FL1419]
MPFTCERGIWMKNPRPQDRETYARTAAPNQEDQASTPIQPSNGMDQYHASFRSIPRDYYQVDPIAIQSSVNIFTSNARSYLVIKAEQFGDVLFVAIGATDVGTVRMHEKFQKHGTLINKGDEIGYFQFGGSSIIVAFRKEAIRFDQDLLDLSRQKIQVSVEVGMSLGRANPMNKKLS